MSEIRSALTSQLRTRAAPSRSEQFYPVGAVLEEQGATEPQLRLLIAGWAARTQTLDDGRRQILRLFVPGDLCGVPLVVGRPSPCAIVTLTQARLATPAGLVGGESATEDLLDLIRMAEAEERLGMVHQITRLGRLSAYERTAHLLLELFERLQRAGLTSGGSMPLPLTQEVLADTLGLSVVHMNRVLQQLRRERLIVLRTAVCVVPDSEALAAICGYDLGRHA